MLTKYRGLQDLWLVFCIECAEKALNANPLNLTALSIMQYSILRLMKAGDSTYKESDIEPYVIRAFRIYNTIATTGDGSKEHPFFVTRVSDEYNFMRFYLKLWEYSSQSLVDMCDVFTLGETSEYYGEKTITFDTSRSLTLLMKEFKKK